MHPLTELNVLWSVHLTFEMDYDTYVKVLPSPFQAITPQERPLYTISCFCWERDLGKSFSIVRHVPTKWISGISQQRGQYVLGIHQSANGGKIMRKCYGKGVHTASVRGKVQRKEISIYSSSAGLKLIGNLSPTQYIGTYWHAIAKRIPRQDLYFPLGNLDAFTGYQWNTQARPLFPMGIKLLADRWIRDVGIFPTGTLRFREGRWQSGNQLHLLPRPEIMRQPHNLIEVPEEVILSHPQPVDF